jgi:nitrogen fixation protein FixH
MIRAANNNECYRPISGRIVLVCLIGFFGVVSIANAIMIGAAVSTFSGVETSNSYQAGLNFARDAEAALAQDALHWQVKANLRTSAAATLIEIDARDAENRPLVGLQATAHLSHPTDRRADQDVVLAEGTAGHFTGGATPIAGQWDVIIELSRDGQRKFRSRNRVVLQ